MENQKKNDDRQEQQQQPGEEEEEEEEEEEKMETMEKFYSLIRQYREARNRLIGLQQTRPISCGDGDVDEPPEKMKPSKKRKAMSHDMDDDHERRPSSYWVPSFECEDFAKEEVEFPRSTTCLSFPAAPASTNTRANYTSSKNGKEKVEEEDDDASQCLNLRLAL